MKISTSITQTILDYHLQSFHVTLLGLWRCCFVFGQAVNNFFHQRLESIQYKAALVIMRAIRATSMNMSSIKNLVLSHCNREDGFENYLSFAK